MSPGDFFSLQKFKFLILSGNSALYKQGRLNIFKFRFVKGCAFKHYTVHISNFSLEILFYLHRLEFQIVSCSSVLHNYTAGKWKRLSNLYEFVKGCAFKHFNKIENHNTYIFHFKTLQIYLKLCMRSLFLLKQQTR